MYYERQAGVLLKDMDKNVGGQAEQASYQSNDMTSRIKPLSEIGITRKGFLIPCKRNNINSSKKTIALLSQLGEF